MRDYKQYEVYRLSFSLVKEVYILLKKFPEEEKFGLTSQIKRSIISIPSNIAEGASRKSEKDFTRFLNIALGSSFEVDTQLHLAISLGFTSYESLVDILVTLNSIQKQLHGLIKSLSSN